MAWRRVITVWFFGEGLCELAGEKSMFIVFLSVFRSCSRIGEHRHEGEDHEPIGVHNMVGWPGFIAVVSGTPGQTGGARSLRTLRGCPEIYRRLGISGPYPSRARRPSPALGRATASSPPLGVKARGKSKWPRSSGPGPQRLGFARRNGPALRRGSRASPDCLRLRAPGRKKLHFSLLDDANALSVKEIANI